MKGSHFGLTRERDGFSAMVRCLSVRYIEMQVSVGARTMAQISVWKACEFHGLALRGTRAA